MANAARVGRRRRISHVITGLDRAGAQRVLSDLLLYRDKDRFDVEVVSLLPRRGLADEIEAMGIPVWAAGFRKDVSLPVQVAALHLHLARRRPDLVHTWMYHGDVIGGVAAKLTGPRTPVVWHLHHTTMDTERFKPSTRMLASTAARLSYRLPAKILACAESSRRVHVEGGYDPTKMVVIRNGVDVERFRPRAPDDRRWLHSLLGLAPSVRLVGLAARFHPQKDHGTFIAAARRLMADHKDVHFVLCGAGVESGNPAFADVLPTGRFHLLGERPDVPQILAELDVSVLSSAAGEACSLVLLESMASGVPCVTTDVGDSAFLVGKTGKVVAPRDPGALASAIGALLNLEPSERRALQAQARQRAEDSFPLTKVARAIEAVYDEVLSLRA